MFLSTDGLWGSQRPDGSFTGLIGDLATGLADISICCTSISYNRSTEVDFSFPYLHDASVLVTRAPRKLSSALAIFWPYHWTVWIFMLLSILISGAILAFVSRESGDPIQEDVPWNFMLVVRLFLGNSVNSVPAGNASRILLGFLVPLGVVLSASYGGILVSILARGGPFETPLDTLDDLVNAVNDGTVGTIYRNETYESNFFEAASSGPLEAIQRGAFEVLSNTSSSNAYMEVLRSDTPHLAFIRSRKELDFRLAELKMKSNQFHFSKETFLPSMTVILVTKGSPILEPINKKLLQMLSSSLIDHWMKEQLHLKQKNFTEVSEHDAEAKQFTLLGLQSAFYLLGTGLVLGVFCFVLELCTEADRPFSGPGGQCLRG
ncbi:unnamed protein product, partial [Cyprideis torosa]